MNLDWADAGESNEGWYTSSWYNIFYNDDTLGQWIWHKQHGWQYVSEVSTKDDFYVWDNESFTWWYTNSQYYPALYSYSKDAWYWFMADVISLGSRSSARVFYSYDTGTYVSSYLIGGLGGSDAPYTNEAAEIVGFDLGDSNYVFDDYDFAQLGAFCIVPTIDIGTSTSDNHLTAKNGSFDQVEDVNIGINDDCDNNSLCLSGYGTTWVVGGNVSVGGDNSQDTALSLDDYALLRIDNPEGTAAINIGSADGDALHANCIYITYGFIAVKGDATDMLAALSTNSHVWTLIPGFGDWVLNTRGSELVSYYEDSDEGNAAALAATGYDNLGGYTVLSSHNELPTLTWADATEEGGWWYSSSWYGEFYTDVHYDLASDCGIVIWHSTHGWQTVYDTSDSDHTDVWDNGTQSVWYIDTAQYPKFYSYGTGRYYSYVSGAYPNRVFYDWTDETNVSESALIPAAE